MEEDENFDDISLEDLVEGFSNLAPLPLLATHFRVLQNSPKTHHDTSCCHMNYPTRTGGSLIRLS